MSRQYWKPANLLNPVPAVMISCSDNNGRNNIMTAAWCGTVCSDPVMVSVSIRKSRYSHELISASGEFVVNLVSRDLVKACDFVGIKSGWKIDKFGLKGDIHLTAVPSKEVGAPSIAESPISLECKVKQVLELGSHDMFIGEVVATSVDEAVLDENGRLDLKKADLIAYSHGEYFALGDLLGKFSFSTHKDERLKTRQAMNREKRSEKAKPGKEEKNDER